MSPTSSMAAVTLSSRSASSKMLSRSKRAMKVEASQDGTGDAVALVLQLGQLLGLGLGVAKFAELIQQGSGGGRDGVGGGLEQPEVGVFLAGEQPQLHGPTAGAGLAAAGDRPAWVLQTWAASWMASQGLPKGGV